MVATGTMWSSPLVISENELKNKMKMTHSVKKQSVIDKIETLPAPREEYNLNLTYAVRDGIISHCGKWMKGNLSISADIDLDNIKHPSQYCLIPGKVVL